MQTKQSLLVDWYKNTGGVNGKKCHASSTRKWEKKERISQNLIRFRRTPRIPTWYSLLSQLQITDLVLFQNLIVTKASPILLVSFRQPMPTPADTKRIQVKRKKRPFYTLQHLAAQKTLKESLRYSSLSLEKTPPSGGRMLTYKFLTFCSLNNAPVVISKLSKKRKLWRKNALEIWFFVYILRRKKNTFSATLNKSTEMQEQLKHKNGQICGWTPFWTKRTSN